MAPHHDFRYDHYVKRWTNNGSRPNLQARRSVDTQTHVDHSNTLTPPNPNEYAIEIENPNSLASRRDPNVDSRAKAPLTQIPPPPPRKSSSSTEHPSGGATKQQEGPVMVLSNSFSAWQKPSLLKGNAYSNTIASQPSKAALKYAIPAGKNSGVEDMRKSTMPADNARRVHPSTATRGHNALATDALFSKTSISNSNGLGDRREKKKERQAALASSRPRRRDNCLHECVEEISKTASPAGTTNLAPLAPHLPSQDGSYPLSQTLWSGCVSKPHSRDEYLLNSVREMTQSGLEASKLASSRRPKYGAFNGMNARNIGVQRVAARSKLQENSISEHMDSGANWNDIDGFFQDSTMQMLSASSKPARTKEVQESVLGNTFNTVPHTLLPQHLQPEKEITDAHSFDPATEVRVDQEQLQAVRRTGRVPAGVSDTLLRQSILSQTNISFETSTADNVIPSQPAVKLSETTFMGAVHGRVCKEGIECEQSMIRAPNAPEEPLPAQEREFSEDEESFDGSEWDVVDGTDVAIDEQNEREQRQRSKHAEEAKKWFPGMRSILRHVA